MNKTLGLWHKLFGKSNYWSLSELFKSDKTTSKSVLDTFGWLKEFDFYKYSKFQAAAVANNPQVKSAITGIAGQARGEGTYILPAKRRDDKGELVVNARSKKAMRLIEQLNKRIDIDQLIFDATYRMGVYGTCFLEKTVDPVFNVRLVDPRHQPYLKPLYREGTLIIDSWTTNRDNPTKGITYKPDEIIVLPWILDTNTPYGTSMISGIDNELNALQQLQVSATEFAKQNAFPFDIIQVGDSEFQPGDTTMSSFRSSIKNRAAGGIQLTNAPVSGYTAGAGSKSVDFITDQMKFHRDQISDGLIAPPLSKLYDSTEASAKVTRSWVREVLGNSIQHILKTKFEKEAYTPYLIEKGYSVWNVPQLMYNIPEMMITDEINATVALVQAEIMTPEQASVELGFDYDETYWEKQKKEEAKLATANRKEEETKPKKDEEGSEQEATQKAVTKDE